MKEAKALEVLASLVGLALIVMAIRQAAGLSTIPELRRRVGWCWLHGLVEDGGCVTCSGQATGKWASDMVDRQAADQSEAGTILKFEAAK